MSILITDPICLARDANGDMVFPMRRLTGLEAVVENVRVKLSFIKGEWFRNLEIGIPYFERVGVLASEALLGETNNEVKSRAIFRKGILETQGILAILKLDVTFAGATRTLGVDWQARTIFGDTPLDTLSMGA